MNLILTLTVLLLAPLGALIAAEFHVAITGKNSNPGTKASPLRTIQRAADLAQTGDTITVHEGIYRERVKPPRGGVVYQAAPGEKVEIKGSEVVKNWTKVQDGVWKATLPNSFFGRFNPYSDVLQGEWFVAKGRVTHTGAVYLNGEWLSEAATLDGLTNALWFAKVDADNTTIWAQFTGVNPNEQLVEINVRQSVFYPDKPGRNDITVRGFTMRHAATPWAGAQSEQIGLVGTHWSKGWIIESNTISHAACTGITLGLRDFGKRWVANAPGFVETVKYAIAEGGWSRENVGSHIVRYNRISHCEKNGIHGSLGGAFSTITGNTIHDIHVRRLYSGQDQGGIKLLGGVDVVINGNRIFNTPRGIWLDWLGQGAVVAGNLAYDNTTCDLYLEVNHGPIVVANNLFLSSRSLSSLSRGVAYAHNLFAGRCTVGSTTRDTPYLKAHSTVMAGLHDNHPGDDRFYNNIFAGASPEPGKRFASLVADYADAKLPVSMTGNLYIKGALPHASESNPMVVERAAPNLTPVQKQDGIRIEWIFDNAWRQGRASKLVTTEMLGRARVPDAPFENPDGSPIRIATDYFGKPRNESNPTPGPFENPGQGVLLFKIW